MTKKTLIEVTTLNIEDKLEKIGALRNVAVNDAWKRVRQKIQVVSNILYCAWLIFDMTKTVKV